jgi:hypothetical protein
MIRKPQPQWKDRDHLFTPSNITKYEFACSREKMNHTTCCIKIKPKALPHGPVKHLFTAGVRLLMTAEEIFFLSLDEESLIMKGPQMPEDRSGEPDQFYLED